MLVPLLQLWTKWNSKTTTCWKRSIQHYILYLWETELSKVQSTVTMYRWKGEKGINSAKCFSVDEVWKKVFLAVLIKLQGKLCSIFILEGFIQVISSVWFVGAQWNIQLKQWDPLFFSIQLVWRRLVTFISKIQADHTCKSLSAKSCVGSADSWVKQNLA